MKKRKIIIKRKEKYSIFANLFVPDDGFVRKTVIFFHGFLGSKDGETAPQLAKKMTKRNVAVFAFDFPAHGESNAPDECFSILNCVLDLMFVETFIKKMFPNSKLEIFATSFGGTVALLRLFWGAENFEKMVLRCPGINLKKAIASILRIENKKLDLKLLEKTNGLTLGLEKKIHVPFNFFKESTVVKFEKIYNNSFNTKILVLHGEKDKIVELKDIQSFCQIDPKNIKLEVIKNTGHQFKSVLSKNKMLEKSVEFLG